ncbi:MAG: beta-lactamase family protein [Victivallales bacterium]|nr:beta-lactamase family protein [Victivallales bacterium]
MSTVHSESLQQQLEEGCKRGLYPAAALVLVPASGKVVFHFAGGANAKTRFDLASLTKVVAATPLAAKLVEQGRLDLDAPVVKYLPDFASLVPQQSEWRSRVTIRHLLAHCAGLPAGFPFHEKYGNLHDRRAQFRLIRAVPLECEPCTREIYSDLGFLLLGEILEEVLHAPLFQPECGLFCPPPALHPLCLPTEEIPGHPGQFWQGIVHDENARWLDGRAGHAGLFATAAELATFAQAMLTSQSPTLDTFLHPARIVPRSTRCLGWDSPSSEYAEKLHGSPNAVFHTGFTGTYLWIDRTKGRAVIFLSNAVHPHRSCKTPDFFAWRNSLIALAMDTPFQPL